MDTIEVLPGLYAQRPYAKSFFGEVATVTHFAFTKTIETGLRVYVRQFATKDDIEVSCVSGDPRRGFRTHANATIPNADRKTDLLDGKVIAKALYMLTAAELEEV